MHIPLRAALAASACVLLLAVATNIASARNFSTSHQNIRATWASLEFSGEGVVVVRCKVTLEGSFHARTFAKVVNAAIGAITRAVADQNSCREGRVAFFNGAERYNGGTPANTLPWIVAYEAFTGTLPLVFNVRMLLSRFRFGITASGGLCTGQYGNVGNTIVLEATLGGSGIVSSLTSPVAQLSSALIRRDGGLFCPGAINVYGTGSAMQLGSSFGISITLI